MDAKRLEQQIERYFDAALSVDEERELVRLLMVTEVPEHLERDKQVILTLQGAVQQPDHTEAMERLSRQIDEWAAEESRAKRRAPTVRLWRAASIAACAIFIVGIGLQLGRLGSPRDTFDTPEEAYAATREALLAFSAALNKGTDYVAMAVETSEQIEHTVTHQLEKLTTYDNNN